MVYVLDQNGDSLMPTNRHGWVRRALKSGKAKAVRTMPFTIRLFYRTTDPVLQEITLGIDPGRENIGVAAVREDGTCLYAAHCETQNKKIKKRMQKRKAHRQASRRGERLRKKRRAAKKRTIHTKIVYFDTPMGKRPNIKIDGCFFRILPGCEEPSVFKDIINTEARFSNRHREEGWLTPTATQLLRTHINLVRNIQKILPVSRVALELNKFSFMELEAGRKLLWWEYQQGPMYGKKDQMEALRDIQNGKCLLCKKGVITRKHHIYPRHLGGTDRLSNLAGLCEKCHEELHHDKKMEDDLKKKTNARNNKYGAVSTVNQIIPYLADHLGDIFRDQAYGVKGWETKQFRDEHHIKKTHENDAYCIACMTLEHSAGIASPKGHYEIQQFRRHDRALIHRQTERRYYLDGTGVAANRRKRMDQKEAQKMRSRLKVKKSSRSYNDPDRTLPGAVFQFEGKTYIMKLQITNGQYYKALHGNTKNIPAARAKILCKNRGLVTVLFCN